MQTSPSNLAEQALAHYNDLLTDGELVASSRKALDEGLEQGNLIFGGRRLCPYLRPHFITEEEWKRVSSVCEIVFRALQKVKDAAVDDDALLDELGITEIE